MGDDTMTIDELLGKVRYASDTSVTGQLAAEVRRLRAENASLVEVLEYWDAIIPLTEKNESAKDKNRAAIASYREARK
jgi:hypothetical protein